MLSQIRPIDIQYLVICTWKSWYLKLVCGGIFKTENEFPGNSIPTFRSNPEARKRLDKLVKQLANSCSIEEVNFGEGTL